MFLNGACAWATPSTLATLSSWRRFLFGDAYFLGDAFLLATPSLGDAFFPGDAFFLGDAYRRFKRGKDKD